jgi:RNA polymerase sigma factor (TIGR02999 family)
MSESITLLLEAAKTGDATATQRLFASVYAELKLLARAHRRRWQGNETINTTALIHEAFIKLSGSEGYANRTHFYATASKAMRQILVNYAEQQRTEKRGGDRVQVPLDEAELASAASADELFNLEQLLRRLEAENPRRCRIVECRVFGGMSVEETADALDISPATVKREWQIASAMLYRELNPVEG